MTIDDIAPLWSLGLPLSTIGAELDMSRGSVAGQIARARRKGDPRFGLRPPGNQHTTPYNVESDRKPRPCLSKPKRVAEPVKPTPVVAESLLVLVKADAPVRREGGVSLVELPNDGCRFIVSQSGPALYCGALREFGKSWCARHAAIVRSGPGVSGTQTSPRAAQ